MEENKINIKISFYGELIDYTINSDYTYFLKDICKMFNLSENQLNSIAINYKDEDGDIIILSNKDDFVLFLEQVKNKEVDTLIIEINENLNVKEQKQKEKESNNINYNNKNNINNKNNNILYDNFNNNENDIHNKNVIGDAPLIFYLECNSCYISPIINCMYYCKECNICYCEECKLKYSKHPHPFEKIGTEEQFEKFNKEYHDKIKLKQNNNNNINNNINDNIIDNNINNNNNNNIDYNRINNRNQDQNNNDINNNYINHINQYYHDNNNNNYNQNQINDFYNNNNNYNYNHHNHYNDNYNNYNNYNNHNQYNDFYYNNNNYNPNQNNNIFNHHAGFPGQISSMVNQIGNSISQFGSEIENTHLFKNIKYVPKIFEMRIKYGYYLANISNEMLCEALNRTNGNIEEAYRFLVQY